MTSMVIDANTDKSAIAKAMVGQTLQMTQGGDCFYTHGEHRNTPLKSFEVIIVRCASRHIDAKPEDNVDDYTRKHGYFAPAYEVLLKQPDTKLYYLKEMIPTYHAEAGQVHGIIVLFILVATLVVVGIASIFYGYGWWSPLIALVSTFVMFLWQVSLRFYFWMLVGAVRGSLFIFRRALTGPLSFKQYQVLVKHLSRADNTELADVHKLLSKLIGA